MATIQYICFTKNCGYAVAARRMVQMLRSGGHDVEVTSLDGSPNPCFRTVPPTKRPDVQVYHCIPDMIRRVDRIPGSSEVLFATFETLDPPQHWRTLLKPANAIIVPSAFNFSLFSALCGTSNIVHIPHPIDIDIFKPEGSLAGDADPGGTFRFLWVGNWKRRKGYEHLIEAFVGEFEAGEQVELMLKTKEKKKAEAFLAPFRKRFPKHRITLNTDELTDTEMAGLYRRAGCFVSPTRGEGFGYPGLEAMACGVPVITTDYSGVTDWATEETAWLLKPKEFEEIFCLDSIPQFTNRRWPVINLPELRRLMRDVTCRSLAASSIRRARIKSGLKLVRENFSIQAVLPKFERVLDLCGVKNGKQILRQQW